jgi:LPXTG-motif cell wall-anchored protein
MTASFAYLVIFSTTPMPILILVGGLMLVGAWYILSKRSRVPADTDE